MYFDEIVHKNVSSKDRGLVGGEKGRATVA